jgi:hypothetical protein
MPKGDNILVLAGQNEAGKSAVIEALNFFQSGETPEFNRLQRRQDLSPLVTCQFQLDEAEIQALASLAEAGDLRDLIGSEHTIKYSRGDKAVEDGEIYLDDQIYEAIRMRTEKRLRADLESAATEGAQIAADAQQEYVVDEKELEKAVEEKMEKVLDYLSERICKFTLYVSFSDILPGVARIVDIDKYPAIKDFQNVFKIDLSSAVTTDERAISRVELRLQEEASDDLNRYWRHTLEEGGEYYFRVKIVPNRQDPKMSMIEFKIDRGDADPLFPEQKSKGFQWFSAFNLRLRSLGIDRSTINRLVILIDEPGQGLSEKAQRDVKRVLEELATQGAQIIYTTHCPNLIGIDGRELSRIRLVSNTKALGSKVETLTQYISHSDSTAKDTLSPIVTAMGIHSIGAILDYQKCNVVVEGISDHYYLVAFRKILNKSDRLYFLPACGANNVPNLVSILIGWGMNYKAVFDDDSGSGRLACNLLKKEFYSNDDTEAHNHLYKIKGCNGIEDVFSRDDFHNYVLTEELKEKHLSARSPNSKIAADRKELLARLFLSSVEEGKVMNLSNETTKRVNNIFDWLYEKFGLTP